MRLKYGRNIATKKYIDSSPCISFTTEGYSHRQSGRFMSITNTQIETESVFANLLCGEWLVTKIVHTFRKGKYENEITGVKTYFYNKVAAPDNNSKAEQIDKLSGLGI
jgi:hypothetical protein